MTNDIDMIHEFEELETNAEYVAKVLATYYLTLFENGIIDNELVNQLVLQLGSKLWWPEE